MITLHEGDRVKVLRGGDSLLASDMAGCVGVVEAVYLTSANVRFWLDQLPETAKLFEGDSQGMAGPYNFSKMDLELLSK